MGAKKKGLSSSAINSRFSFLRIEREADEKDVEMDKKGFGILDVGEDGNCGYYSLLLGLVMLNKIPAGVKLLNSTLVAAMYKL